MARVTLIKKGVNPFEVVNLKIMHDITKLGFDQIRINCIKKKEENTGRLVKLLLWQRSLNQQEKKTKKKTPTHTPHTHHTHYFLILSTLHNRQIWSSNNKDSYFCFFITALKVLFKDHTPENRMQKFQFQWDIEIWIWAVLTFFPNSFKQIMNNDVKAVMKKQKYRSLTFEL